MLHRIIYPIFTSVGKTVLLKFKLLLFSHLLELIMAPGHFVCFYLHVRDSRVRQDQVNNLRGSRSDHRFIAAVHCTQMTSIISSH